MKIKLAILEKDSAYLSRMVSVFGTKYADRLEIYSFTDQDIALATLASARIDVLVASDAFDIKPSLLPKRCGFAYFVDSPDVESVNDQRAICKFQKAEMIYKQILSIFAEKATNLSGIRFDDDSCAVIAFASAGGGVGASSMAAACAIRYAGQGKKVLYVNLEQFGTADSYFSGEGKFDMGDVIFSLKSKRTNLQMKLESHVRRDPTGVSFFAGTKVALDMMSLGTEEVLQLISELKLTGSYEYIILDMDFALSEDKRKIMKACTAVVLVSDGSETCNTKTFRAYTALDIMEQNADTPLTARMKLIYNKFSNKTSQTLTGLSLKEIGGAPRYQHAAEADVVRTLATLDVFDKIL